MTENIKTIFSNDIEVYEYALNQIPPRDKAKKSFIVRNDTKEHAIKLVKALFKRAEKEIYIKSSLLCKDFYLDDEIKNILKEKSKNKNLKVKILIEKKSDNDVIGQKSSIEFFKKYFKSNVIINFLSEEYQRKVNDFIVIDKYDFRFELEPPKLENACDKEEIVNVKATASFNTHKDEKNQAEEFIKIFNTFIPA